MASLMRSLGEFDSSTELFTAYLERLEQYFIANSIGQNCSDAEAAAITLADKKVSVVISVIGKKAYGTLRDLCSPTSSKEKSFSELCQLLQDHNKPKRLEVAETYRFHRYIQDEN